MAYNAKKLVDIQNGGPDLHDEVREAQMLHNEDERAFAVRKRVYEGHGKVRRKIRFFEGTHSDVRTSGAKMVQSNESVVKCSDPLVKARSMGGPNWWGWWAAVCRKKRVPEQRRLRACRREKKTQEEVIKVIAPGRRFEKNDCVWSKRIQNVEADNDVIKVVSVSSSFEVVSVGPEPEPPVFPSSVILLAVTEWSSLWPTATCISN